MHPYQQSVQNDLDGLNWLHRFGWLRTHELGPLLWPSNSAARHRADRLARSWRQRGLVIERVLPHRAGRALTLAARGVRMLSEAGIKAASGKDVGETREGVWTPPSTWRHSLLASGVLVDLYLRGFDVLPEAHIRRNSGWVSKHPDGLAVKGNQVVYVEVESARKTGPAMKSLAEALCLAGDASAEPIMGLLPTHAMVAFAVGQRDERGHALNHRERVSKAVASVARRAAPITWAACTLRGYGVESINYSDDLIDADRAAAVLRRLELAGWRSETGVLVSPYGSRRALIWEDDEADCWAWQVDDLPAGRVGTVSEAKRRCAEVLAQGLMR